jgi:hypothetical protein
MALNHGRRFAERAIQFYQPLRINFNDNVIPSRLPYPSSEENLNGTNMTAALKGAKNDKKMKMSWVMQRKLFLEIILQKILKLSSFIYLLQNYYLLILHKY